ncbi:MAG: hypothetical protein HY350_01880 [Candidatus Omnitrophica bacterium]|nr:hypothetical protein [Candidatus Omnitrophota bacterium]
MDKPFSYTLKDAHAIIDMAGKYNTPIMCSSLLRQSPYLERFKKRFLDIAPVGCLVVPCSGPSLAGVFHGISIVQAVLGEGCEWVESMGPKMYDFLRLHYSGSAGGIEVIVFNMCGDMNTYPSVGAGHSAIASEYQHCGYTVSAYGAGGAIHSPRIDDYLFPEGGIKIVNMAKRMVKTGKPPIPYESMLELIEIIEAARLAHDKGIKVFLKDIRKNYIGNAHGA